MATPTTPSILYTDRDSIESILSENGLDLRADDDASGTISAAEETRVDQAAAVATGTINRFCQQRYSPEQLAQSWSVWHWSAIIAAVWMCRRRGNPIPKSLLQEYNEILAELREVQAGAIVLEDIALRTSDAPIWSNTTLDPMYRSQQIRVQRRRSEGTPRDHPVAQDYYDTFVVEP